MINLYPLPYSYNSLEPHIGAETMDVHYNRHYKGYYKNFIQRLKELNIEESDPIAIWQAYKKDKSIRDNGGGYITHTWFWQSLKPNNGSPNLPSGYAKERIIKDFGSYENFKEDIKNEAKSRFGSGWVWWVEMENGETYIISTPNQDLPSPFMYRVLLGIDVWEHAYYLDYLNEREDYVENLLKVVDWETVNERLR